MEEHLRKSFNFEVDLVPGAGGIFDVLADGDLLFSKFRAGRFPETAEIEVLIRKKIDS